MIGQLPIKDKMSNSSRRREAPSDIIRDKPSLAATERDKFSLGAADRGKPERVVTPAGAGRSIAEAMCSKDGADTSHDDEGDSTPRLKSSAMARKSRGEDAESKSLSSENNPDGASADDMDLDASATPGKRRGRKRCYRHTQHQILEMERLFKECPHPDEKARLELSKELNLDPRQVKFWFQNKRTQMKTQQERHDNSYLRNENDKLRAEIKALRDALKQATCSKCGVLAVNDHTDQVSPEEQRSLIDNVEMDAELNLSGGQRVQTVPAATSSTLDGLAQAGLSSNHASSGPSVAEIATHPLCLTDSEKLMVVDLAVSAMEELAQIAQAVEPLWMLDLNSTSEVLDRREYQRQFKNIIGPAISGTTAEATRETDVVMIDARSVIETFMEVDLWAQMFSSIVARAWKVEALSSGPIDPFDGAMQVVYAELQLPTPFVPTRDAYFLRYSKRVDHQWLVVDVCIDSLRANPPPSLLKCRKRPSGCVLEETTNGYSKITWVEHVEVDNAGVHPIYQSLVNSGIGFGAQLWVATLQRQCKRIASLLANRNFGSKDTVLANNEGRLSVLKLAERMTNNFCAGVSAASKHSWITLSGSGTEDFKVVIRESIDDPGRPPGIVLSAATSLRLPVSPARLFHFLCDHSRRTEWDILSNMGVVEETVYVSKGDSFGNSVSLLKVNSVSSNPSNSLILQDCCSDKSCFLVVYALVDMDAMKAVLNGGDPDVVTLLPSGFAILPDRTASSQSVNHLRNGSHQKISHMIGSVENPSASLLTMAFQILVDHELSAKLSLESVATINNLISSTIMRIKRALSCDQNHQGLQGAKAASVIPIYNTNVLTDRFQEGKVPWKWKLIFNLSQHLLRSQVEQEDRALNVLSSSPALSLARVLTESSKVLSLSMMLQQNEVNLMLLRITDASGFLRNDEGPFESARGGIQSCSWTLQYLLKVGLCVFSGHCYGMGYKDAH
ncbi:hypothetical protein GOP47_0030207 [Adiantum capillus-veneris]|nr:hypothetical protein GOP47_0030207 [Adiantum capillus-veneris]